MELQLTFYEATSAEDTCRKLRESPAIVVWEEESLSPTYLSTATAVAESGARLVLVLGHLSHGDVAKAVRAGALACMEFDEALQGLAYLISNLAADTSYSEELVAMDTVIIAERYTFSTFDYVLSDGQRRVDLPPVLGRVLVLLASHQNQLVSSRDLIRAGWGDSEVVSLYFCKKGS
jgi:DNA-binding response OmpR family regulator